MAEHVEERQTEPLVSVLALTYNQGEYVEDMLKGFLRQETTFPVEFIIHDDASTDGTRQILEWYEEEHPGIFQMIYEDENQWSKGVKITRNILLPRARGKYIAFCEGDDFWIDKNKLQKQADFLEAHPDCVCVAHNALIWDCENNLINAMDVYDSGRVLSARDIIDRRHPALATASKMHRKEVLWLPPLFLSCGEVGDMPTDFYAFTKGKIYYAEDIMSVYRYKSKGSWSVRTTDSHQKLIMWSAVRCTFFSKYNAYTHGDYEFYLSLYMTRSVQNVIDVLERSAVNEEKFLCLLNEVKEITKEHDRALEEIKRIVSFMLYGKNEKFVHQILALSGKKIYLYGAGRYGLMVANFFRLNKLEYDGFVVEDLEENPPEVEGKKVISIMDYVCIKEEAVLVIALGSVFWEEVSQILHENKISEYIYPILVKPYITQKEISAYE